MNTRAPLLVCALTIPLCAQAFAGTLTPARSSASAGRGPAAEPSSDGPYLATGIKIGEATSSSVIVWVRLTAADSRVAGQFAVPGVAGAARLKYRRADVQGDWTATSWTAVDAERDFTHQFNLADLAPGCGYELQVWTRGSASTTDPTEPRMLGHFRTAPAPEDPAAVRFCVVTGQDFHRRDDKLRGHHIYTLMEALAPDFFAHTGDILYYDKPDPVAKNVAQAREHWQRMYSLPNQVSFHAQVTSYFEKDDHDTLKNDCWPGQKIGELTFAQGLEIFREQVPMGASTYRTVRWGKDLQVWFTEGRDFRSSNRDPDGPDKTILGAEQLAWLRRTMSASDATFRVLINPTPIIGPDRKKGKNDNHSNVAFAHEGTRLRAFLGSLGNAIVICGDRHWQYVSVDASTGLREFSCGPTTNKHAGGFRLSDRTEAHRYLNVIGGFLEAVVERVDGQPQLVLRHHDVAGAVTHEELIRAKR